MTTTSSSPGAIIDPSQFVEFVDTAEKMCTKHGPAIADELRLGLELTELVQAGFSEEDIDAYAEGTKLGEYIDHQKQIEQYSESLGENHSDDVAYLFAHPSPTEIREVAKEIVADLPPSLLPKLSFGDLANIVLANAYFVASIHRQSPHLNSSSSLVLESSLVNQITTELVQVIDTDAICKRLLTPGTAENSAVQSLDALAQYYASSLTREFPDDPGNANYFSAKIEQLKAYLSHVDVVRSLVSDAGEVELTPEAIERSRELNDELAKKLGKIRRYDVKPLVFSSENQGGDRDISYREYRDLELFQHGSKMHGGDAVLAAANLGHPGIPLSPVLDFTELKRRENPAEIDARLFKLETSDGIMTIDRGGELWFGVNLPGGESPALPMRDFFEKDGKPAEYEQLRARVLANLFDAVAPASIVAKVDGLPGPNSPQPNNEPTELSEPTDVVYDMVLPRVRYLSRPTKDIKREFYQAQQTEDAYVEEQQRLVRKHGVASHLRLIPPNARPSLKAVADSKAKWGTDYELPAGYTFVNSHTRGTESLGKVIGHQGIKVAF